MSGTSNLCSLLEATAPTYNAMCQTSAAAIKFGLSDLDNKTSGAGSGAKNCASSAVTPAQESQLLLLKWPPRRTRREEDRPLLDRDENRPGTPPAVVLRVGTLLFEVETAPQIALSVRLPTSERCDADGWSWPIYINDYSGLSPQTFAAQVRQAVLRNNVDLVSP